MRNVHKLKASITIFARLIIAMIKRRMTRMKSNSLLKATGLCLLFALLLTSYNWSKVKGVSPTTVFENSGHTIDITKKITPHSPIQATIDKMSLKEKIGQLVMVGVDSTSMDRRIKKLIQQQHVSGAILFTKNLESVQQAKQLINNLKKSNANNPASLFIGIDEEGGRVSRMPEEFLSTPASREIGDSADLNWAYHTGQVIAMKVASLGFNINFAPVLDIDSNSNNPVIGDRSFGSSPAKVSDFGITQMKGMQSEQVISVVKHFPGHGDTTSDSHIQLPTIDHPKSRLMQVELLPFQRAITKGADAVMVGHLLVTAYDNDSPASMSKTIISGLLREELDFNGVVVADDMTMGAIQDNYDIGEAAVQSIKAGSDLILVCHDYDNAESVINGIKYAVQADEITEMRIDQSVERILKLKQKYQLTDASIEHVAIDEINQAIKTW